MKAAELREMSDEQLGLTLEDTCKILFRMRIQAQSEPSNAAAEMKRQRRLIARIKSVRREREIAAKAAAAS
ncbi:MAG: 50S ribosomal protein L29 [Pirellulaceae bacterium]|jgi:large subunit ribosomal protein L29|nr:50S ribosomal protein L29 [Planctomycetaceae bacterium]MDP6442363.1 50S ribosomal protein L29 [Pirellulaceae bacterium]MDP7015283.1 50S ribosomal protein L29 [Pirellulaceae bacterium]